MLADRSRVRNGNDPLRQSKLVRSFQRRLADKGQRTSTHGTAKRAEHRPVVLGLRSGNGSIGITHDSGGDHARLEHHVRLYAEKGWVPNHNIGDLPHFNRADIAGYALSYRRVDRVLGDVAARSEVIVLAVLFRQPSKLLFHLVGGLPHPRDHLAYAPHRLTVG